MRGRKRKIVQKVEPEAIPVTFVPVSKVFKPQVQVVAIKDVSGWADRARKIRWSMSAWQTYTLDHDTARDFAVKKYVYITDGKVLPVSEDEKAEILSHLTVITPGGNNG